MHQVHAYLRSSDAMPLFLWHTVGFAIFYAFMRFVWEVPETPSLMWWVTRPLWLVGPALATLPLLAVTTRVARGGSASLASGPHAS